MAIPVNLTKEEIQKSYIAEVTLESERYHHANEQGTGNSTLIHNIDNDFIMSLIKKHADNKILKMCERIEAGKSNKYYKITAWQKRTLADFLLLIYGNQRAVFCEAFNTTEEEMFGGKLDNNLETTLEEVKKAHERKKAASEKYKENNERNAMLAEFAGLPKLKGTEKQVAWAESIRMRCLNRGANFMSDKLMAYKEAKKAKWWIENKPETPTEAVAILESNKVQS